MKPFVIISFLAWQLSLAPLSHVVWAAAQEPNNLEQLLVYDRKQNHQADPAPAASTPLGVAVNKPCVQHTLRQSQFQLSQLPVWLKIPFPPFPKGGNLKSPFCKGRFKGIFDPAQDDFDETLLMRVDGCPGGRGHRELLGTVTEALEWRRVAPMWVIQRL